MSLQLWALPAQVLAIEGSVPQLEELHLCSNRITTLTPPITARAFGGDGSGGLQLLFPHLKVPVPSVDRCLEYLSSL